MKRVFLSILSICMVTALLVNTAGITVYNHFCMEEGESSLSFTRKEKCCEDKKEVKTEVKKDKHTCCQKETAIPAKNKLKKPGCCSQEEFSAQWQLNEFSFHKNILISAPELCLPDVLLFSVNTIRSAEFSESKFYPPPKFSSPDILILHSVLII
jgi:hypothetical protein